MHGIFPSARLKPSPYYHATVAEGVASFTVYNNMLMPTGYGQPEPEYWRIINGVSLWDVACERQVQLRGPDAGKLAQILCPRDLSACRVGQGKYIPMCNHQGILINDPILLKLAEDLYWFSIADSNIWFWAAAIAAERGLDVEVSEPDVSPLAIQGPKAEALALSLFGEWVKDLKYFWFKQTSLQGIPMVVARSGWSKQGGFELYLMDGSRGTELWNAVKEAGKPWDIGPGNPNLHERVESGLISYGGDTDSRTNPYEVRLGKYVDLHVPDDVIGIQALRRLHAQGPKRHQLGIKFEGDRPDPFGFSWEPVCLNGQQVGSLTNAAWSYRLKQNIGFALVSTTAQPGDTVEVQRASGKVRGHLCTLPFV